MAGICLRRKQARILFRKGHRGADCAQAGFLNNELLSSRAKALDMMMPPSILQSANDVIE
jgi:hypothetical protein